MDSTPSLLQLPDPLRLDGAQRDAGLRPALRKLWEDNYRVYGARKLWEARADWIPETSLDCAGMRPASASTAAARRLAS